MRDATSGTNHVYVDMYQCELNRMNEMQTGELTACMMYVWKRQFSLIVLIIFVWLFLEN